MGIAKEKAKERLKILVKEFSEGEKYWNTKPEEDIKHQFIEPLFEEILGWGRKSVQKESRVLKGRADYILKLGNQELLVIEAKKTNVPLMEEEGRQSVSYAYHRKIKFAVLTNFKEIRVYHALSNIKNIDKNLLRIDGNYFKLNVSEFIDKFDWLWLLSKESFDKGEINKLLSSKDEKINKPIDETILEDLLKIREWLSKELKLKKNYLSQEVIDEIVQILIDRLIFIRSAEDRGLEPMNYLRSFESDVTQQRVKLQLFPYLLKKFEEFNQKYDSKLFEMGVLEKEGIFSDDVLRKVILALYFGIERNQERYLFDQIPGDLFGSIYEQYLGTILAGTEKRVKLDSSSGKRKKMGIYYTPSYIVDYIIKNTVHEYIKDKTINEILNIKVLDPACGSGSFLIKAFQEVCDIVEDKLKKGERGSKIVFKNYSDRLNLGQKVEILTSCIHGVDLDEKAVELARLNLLLKLLDGEGQETKKLLLPHLENNIKCGNSLIDDSKVSDRAFNWHAQFPDVFRNGGFDVVVGNPPYVKIQTFTENKETEFFEKNYISSTGNFDLYVLFVEKAHKILKDSGVMGFILPHKFFQSDFGEGIRKYILDNRTLKKIVDFKDNQIFEGATTYTCLLFLNKNNKNIDYTYQAINESSDLERELNDFKDKEDKLNMSDLKSGKWIFSNKSDSKIFNKINKNKDSSLGKFCKAIFQGIATGADGIFFLTKINEDDKFTAVHSKSLNQEVILESSLLRPLVKGNMLKRFTPVETKEVILFPYLVINNKVSLIEEKELKNKFPKAYNYLKKFEKELRGREKGRFDNSSWYCFSRNQGMSYLEKKKILTPDICQRGESSVDYDGNFLTTTTIYGVIPNEDKHFEFLLSILNSSLLRYFIRNTGSILRGGFFRYKTAYLSPFPIRLPSPSQEQKIISLVNQMLELQKKYHDEKISGNERERLKQQIDNTDYELDEEVYKLYGITAEEKKIIEESLKK